MDKHIYQKKERKRFYLLFIIISFHSFLFLFMKWHSIFFLLTSSPLIHFDSLYRDQTNKQTNKQMTITKISNIDQKKMFIHSFTPIYRENEKKTNNKIYRILIDQKKNIHKSNSADHAILGYFFLLVVDCNFVQTKKNGFFCCCWKYRMLQIDDNSLIKNNFKAYIQSICLSASFFCLLVQVSQVSQSLLSSSSSSYRKWKSHKYTKRWHY